MNTRIGLVDGSMKFTRLRIAIFILFNFWKLAKYATQGRLPFVCEALAADWNNGILPVNSNEKGFDYSKLMGLVEKKIEVKASSCGEFSSLKSKFGIAHYFHFIDLRTGQHAIIPEIVVKKYATHRKGDSFQLNKINLEIFNEYRVDKKW